MPPKGSKSPAPRGKAASRSKSPPPPTTTTTTTTEKASPKRAVSATKKAATPVPKKAASASPSKPSAKKSKKQLEEEEHASDNEEELPPQTQNQLSQSSKKARSPSPKNSKKQQQKNEDAAEEEEISAEEKASFYAQTHDSPAAKKQIEEAAKRCKELPKAVHSMFAYLKKKATEVAKKNGSQQQQQKQQQNSVDDVLALFGPQNNNSAAAAAENAFADNNGVPTVEVSVEFNFIRAPKPSRIPWSIVLPNQVHDIDKSICLITPAPQEKYRNQIEDEHAEVQAPANIQKIMDVKKLEGRFQDPVARRALAKSYSAFWVHNEVDTFPQTLTGEFMSHHFPVWVNGKKSLHINERLQRTLSCVMLPRQGHDNVTVVIGHTKQSEEQLIQNVRAFCGHVIALLQNDWKDVLSIRISFRDFAAGVSDRRISLPFYAHDFKESHGLGSDAAVVPKAMKVPSNIRKILAESTSTSTTSDKKESGKIRQRDAEEEEEEKKVVAAAASPVAASKPSPKKPNNSADAKKAATAASDDEDDDEIPQIDASASPKKASASASPKKPAPKGKKAAAKK